MRTSLLRHVRSSKASQATVAYHIVLKESAAHRLSFYYAFLQAQILRLNWPAAQLPTWPTMPLNIWPGFALAMNRNLGSSQSASSNLRTCQSSQLARVRQRINFINRFISSNSQNPRETQSQPAGMPIANLNFVERDL